MSRDLILTDEDGVRYDYNNIRTQSWLEGHACGLDAAVAYLKETAVELFRRGNDEEATAMRKMADTMKAKLRPEMERRAKHHEQDHPEVVEGDR